MGTSFIYRKNEGRLKDEPKESLIRFQQKKVGLWYSYELSWRNNFSSGAHFPNRIFISFLYFSSPDHLQNGKRQKTKS